MTKEQEVIKQFKVDGEMIECIPLGNGHINITFLCTMDNGKRYVLQRINDRVFPNIPLLMSNYSKVTQYLLDHNFEAARIMRTLDDQTYCYCFGGYYRLFDYLENTVWNDNVESDASIFDAAKAFGVFHKTLRGFNAEELGEIIPNFHNTYQRYLNLEVAIKENKFDRVKMCLPEIEFAERFKNEYSKITDAIKDGSIPLSVTHNDPKINNVLFDADTGVTRAIVDLDTIMPGSYLYDFGDAIRSLFTMDNEDTTDLSKLVVNYHIFEIYARGYLSETKDVLNKKEIELLPFSAFLLTAELVLRFLEDFLRGDAYFKTNFPEHNLVRARTQMKLANEIYQHLDELKDIVKKVLKEME